MEFFNKIKQIFFDIGLTQKELRLIVFLILILVIGLGLKAFKGKYYQYEKFDYTYLDSLVAVYENIDTTDNVFELESDTIILSALNIRQNISKNKLPLDIIININEAPLEALCKLPDIGPKTAETIIEHRKKFGKFKSIEGIMKVKGIGQKKYDKIKNNITIENE